MKVVETDSDTTEKMRKAFDLNGQKQRITYNLKRTHTQELMMQMSLFPNSKISRTAFLIHPQQSGSWFSGALKQRDASLLIVAQVRFHITGFKTIKQYIDDAPLNAA